MSFQFNKDKIICLLKDQGVPDPLHEIDWASYPGDIPIQDWLKNEYSIVLKESIKDNRQDIKEKTEAVKQVYKEEDQGENIGLPQIFEHGHIIGFAGKRNTRETNNLCYLIKKFRQTNKATQIFIYGFPQEVVKYLKQYGVVEIDSLRQLINKRDCIIIMDEMQRLKINDRRYTEIKSEFSDFVYHNNVYAILCSPSIREFNSVIGSIIEGWIVKSIDIDQCVNGSQLKQAIDEYQGNYKTLGTIDTTTKEDKGCDKLLILNDEESITIHCDYVPEADTKKGLRDLFSQEIVKELSKKVI
jgi:hypothetical protein